MKPSPQKWFQLALFVGWSLDGVLAYYKKQQSGPFDFAFMDLNRFMVTGCFFVWVFEAAACYVLAAALARRSRWSWAVFVPAYISSLIVLCLLLA